MSDLTAEFEAAQVRVKGLSERPSNDNMLQLYALFKQGSIGDVTGKRPGMMDMINRAKYDAWAGHQGKSQEEAMQAYIDLVTKLGA